MKTKNYGHPYIPNSAKKVKEEMMKEIDIKEMKQLYDVIPSELKVHEPLNMPEPILSEYGLKKHVEEILSKNKNCKEYLNK